MFTSWIRSTSSSSFLSFQIRTLLRDYLTDEERGATSGRHPIASINEVLREGRVIRDKSRVRSSTDCLHYDVDIPIIGDLPCRQHGSEDIV